MSMMDWLFGRGPDPSSVDVVVALVKADLITGQEMLARKEDMFEAHCVRQLAVVDAAGAELAKGAELVTALTTQTRDDMALLARHGIVSIDGWTTECGNPPPRRFVFEEYEFERTRLFKGWKAWLVSGGQRPLLINYWAESSWHLHASPSLERLELSESFKCLLWRADRAGLIGGVL